MLALPVLEAKLRVRSPVAPLGGGEGVSVETEAQKPTECARRHSTWQDETQT